MASKFKIIMTACFLLSAATFITANAAIAKQCYDDNKEYTKSHTQNNNFLISGLVAGPLCIICALLAIVAGIRAP